MAVRGRIRVAELDGFRGGHAVADRSGEAEADGAEMEERDVDLQAVGDLADPVVEHGVA